MTKIVHLTSVHRPSDQRILHKECRTLAAAGYDVILLAAADPIEQIDEDIHIRTVPKPKRRWQRPLAWWRLMREICRIKPSFVHFHDPELLLTIPFLRLFLGRRIHIIYDVHEYFVTSIAHKVWIPSLLSGIVARMAQIAEYILGHGIDGLVFVVEEQKPFYSNWYVPKVVLHNYPLAEAFASPTPLPDHSSNRFRLIHIGSLYERRGIMTMLESLTYLVPKVPETLLILGGYFESDEFRQRVNQFIVENNLQDHVKLYDGIEHSQLKNYLASADVGWLSGFHGQQYHQRAISTKQLEFMIMGLPILCGENFFVREFVDEAKCGIVVEDTPQAYAEALYWLYLHPSERKEMGKRGLAIAAEKYTWEHEASKLYEFYTVLASSSEGI